MGDDLTGKFDAARRYLEDENRILLGQQGGLISGQIERAPTAGDPPAQKTEKQHKKDNATQRFIHAHNLIQDFNDRLEQEIAELKDGFRARHGEEWREKLALRILGERRYPAAPG